MSWADFSPRGRKKTNRRLQEAECTNLLVLILEESNQILFNNIALFIAVQNLKDPVTVNFGLGRDAGRLRAGLGDLNLRAALLGELGIVLFGL